ncbi:hypothetical protein [Streptomyces aureus]|uniref:hypothetical protein n=1 Tax=Streptomyces aureus TaxID=193461 RepID=UPI00367F6CC0
MQTFVTVVVILTMIAFAALLINVLNSQHGERIPPSTTAVPGPVPGPDLLAPEKAHGPSASERHRTPPRSS